MTDVRVCLSIDFDATSIWLMLGQTGARAMSRGEFGATTGAPRLLELCRRYEIPSTWFVPGHTADTFTPLVEQVAAAGHELANHGYLHEDFSMAPPLPAAMPNPRDVESVWRDEFDYMADRLEGAYFMIMCHPQTIGWGSRIAMLERFVEHCRDRGARFVTCGQIADEFRAS